MPIRSLLISLVASAFVSACSTMGYPFKLVDARTETRFGDARTTVQGAEVILADDAISPSLVDRLATALEDRVGASLEGKEVRIEKALATITVDDARVSPQSMLRRGGALPVLRDVTLTAQKHVVVEYAGTVDERKFAGRGEEAFRLGDGALELSRAIGAAVNSAVTSARAQLN